MNDEIIRYRDEIVINGKKLNEEQVTVLVEAIYGHVQFGIQYDGFLKGACGISLDRGVEIVNEIDEMFIR